MPCYVLGARDPERHYLARLEYRDPDPFTTWLGGEPFLEAPVLPLRVRVISDPQTCWGALWETPLPVMSKALLDVILGAGITEDQIQTYPVELHDAHEGRSDVCNFMAFNLCRSVSLLDLPREGQPMIARAREHAGLILINGPVQAALCEKMRLNPALFVGLNLVLLEESTISQFEL